MVFLGITRMPPQAWTICATLVTGFLLPGNAHAASEVDYISYPSKELKRNVRIGIYLPDGYDSSESDRYPCLYFLHGMFGSEMTWESRGTAELLDDLIENGDVPPMIVVCPNGENSMYVNWKNGKGNWGSFVSEELVTYIDEKYRTLAHRRSRGISGDSMGGYGALTQSFQHPDTYGSVSAHSAALYPEDPDQLPDWVKRRAEHFVAIYGAEPDTEHWTQNNPLFLARTLSADQLKSLDLYFDCGDQDKFGFDKTNTTLSSILKEQGVPHTFSIRPGDHGRRYFRKYVEHSLIFHGNAYRSSAKEESEAPEDSP